jgi:sirohydrochlorin cobaltochelatase
MSHHPTAVIVIGHGTRDPHGTAQFHEMVKTLQVRDSDYHYYPAFMELAEPEIDNALDLAAADGHRAVLCQPALLLTAGHAKNDLPAMVRHAAEHHPEVEVTYGSPIELTAELVKLCAEHVAAAMEGLDPATSTLLVVGRGTSDPDANSNVAKLARLLEEGLGFGESAVSYFSATRPQLPEGLDRVAARAVGPVVVFPFILFSGALDALLNVELDRTRTSFPTVEFRRTVPFGSMKHFADAFLERVHRSAEPTGTLACLLCKYRAPMSGREGDVGLPQQEGHHHHHHNHGVHHHEHKPSGCCHGHDHTH